MPHINANIEDLVHQGPILPIRFTISLALETALRQTNLSKTLDIADSLAMIDTGATRTVVNPSIIQKLNLHPIGQVQINTPSSVNVNCFEYAVRIIFPNNIVINDMIVIDAPLSGQHIQCLIGRDLLSLSTFYYNGTNNSFSLSL